MYSSVSKTMFTSFFSFLLGIDVDRVMDYPIHSLFLKKGSQNSFLFHKIKLDIEVVEDGDIEGFRRRLPKEEGLEEYRKLEVDVSKCTAITSVKDLLFSTVFREWKHIASLTE